MDHIELTGDEGVENLSRAGARPGDLILGEGKVPTQRTLDAAAFTFLITRVPAAHPDATVLAELYRVRWRVELNFKRWKGIFDLDRFRAGDPNLARAYIYAKPIAARLSDTLARPARAFSPWGLPTSPLALAPGGLA